MKVALIGATGFVGSALMEELLLRGHEVVALARQPGKIAARAHLTAVQADVTNVQEVEAAIKGVDAVVSAYNAGWANPNIYADFMKGSRAIVQGLKAAGVKRYLVVGGAGSLYVNGRQLVDSPDFPAAIRDGAAAARDMLTELQGESTLDWTLLSPPIAMQLGAHGERTGTYRVGADEPLMQADGQPGTISAADLAVALVDALEKEEHIRARFTVAY